MTSKKVTWKNLLEFEDESIKSKSVRDSKNSALPHGYVTQVGSGKPRFLIVDDDSSVIRNHTENFKHSLENATAADNHPSVAIWHVDKSEEGNFSAFLGWLIEQESFDGIFLDAHLKMGDMTGFDLANLIHERDQFRYQPLCVLTANYSNQKDKALENPHIKVLLKFREEDALEQMRVALPELKETMRQKFWADCHDEIVNAIEEREASASSVAEALGSYLVKHHGITGWYLRARNGEKLKAIAMLDEYEGKDCLTLRSLPKFLRKVLKNSAKLSPKSNSRFAIKANLKTSECGDFPALAGHHALAITMRADNGDLSGLFTAYRPKISDEFSEQDARELQHLIVHIQSLMISEKKQEFQNSLLGAIDDAREADGIEEMSESILPFLHETINPVRFDDEFCKTSFRVFDRGTGNLVRVGSLLGNCEEIQNDVGTLINVSNDESIIAQSVRDRRTIRHSDFKSIDAKSLRTVKEKLVACLVVPLNYDGAVLGVLNFESSVAGKYSPFDQRLAEKFSGLLASILFRRRNEKFLQKFSDISTNLISGELSSSADSNALMNNCISMLYDLCRFANALLIDAGPFSKISDVENWKIKGWSASSPSIEETDSAVVSESTDRIQVWRQTISEIGESSYLIRSLKATDGESVYFTDNYSEIPQGDIDSGLRSDDSATLSQMVIRVFTPKNSVIALCLMFETPAPFTRQFRSVVEKFAQFISYLESSKFISQSQIYGQVEQYETQLFTMYSALMHSQKKIAAGIVKELVDIEKGNNSFDDGLTRVRKKASLTQMNAEIGKAVLRSDDEIEEFLISEIWSDITNSFSIFLEDKNASILEISSDLNVKAERAKLKTILAILVGNSIEHAGSNFEVSLEAIDEFSLVYRDTGKGISREYQTKIFEHFSTSRTGAGTGLIIARLLARKMGGEISYQSDSKGASGSTFIIELGK